MIDVYAIGAGGAAARQALPPSEREAWARLHAAPGARTSPFLHPAFAEALGAARADVEVAVVRRDGEAAAFLPFARHGALALPLGGRLADVHGPVLAPQLDARTLDIPALLRGSGLRAWRFDRLPAALLPDGARPWRRFGAGVVELEGGFDAYRADRRAAGSGAIDQALRKGRKLAREIGPLHLEWHDDDPEVLLQLLAWKAEQRRRTASPDVLREPWARGAVEHLVAAPGPGAAGRVCSLRAGERLVAAHLGLHGGEVLHWWIPAYDPEFASYSPGLVMLAELQRAAAERGVAQMDLGPGEERYKASLATGEVSLASGEVDLSAWRSLGRRFVRRSRERIRTSRLEPSYVAVKAALRRLERAGDR